MEENNDIGGAVDISRYRISKALVTLKSAEDSLASGQLSSVITKAYYVGFYSANAVLVLDGKQYRRHKDVVGNFNKDYVHGGVFDLKVGSLLHQLGVKRQDADYEDFARVTWSEANNAYLGAKYIYTEVSKYVLSKIGDMSELDIMLYALVNPDDMDDFLKRTPMSILNTDNVAMMVMEYYKDKGKA